tara:strand:+ start:263 stop:490 length:228 start_codon:yes stop_codon:yes gene_type:complete
LAKLSVPKQVPCPLAVYTVTVGQRSTLEQDPKPMTPLDKKAHRQHLNNCYKILAKDLQNKAMLISLAQRQAIPLF